MNKGLLRSITALMMLTLVGCGALPNLNEVTDEGATPVDTPNEKVAPPVGGEQGNNFISYTFAKHAVSIQYLDVLHFEEKSATEIYLDNRDLIVPDGTVSTLAMHIEENESKTLKELETSLKNTGDQTWEPVTINNLSGFIRRAQKEDGQQRSFEEIEAQLVLPTFALLKATLQQYPKPLEESILKAAGDSAGDPLLDVLNSARVDTRAPFLRRMSIRDTVVNEKIFEAGQSFNIFLFVDDDLSGLDSVGHQKARVDFRRAGFSIVFKQAGAPYRLTYEDDLGVIEGLDGPGGFDTGGVRDFPIPQGMPAGVYELDHFQICDKALNCFYGTKEDVLEPEQSVFSITVLNDAADIRPPQIESITFIGGSSRKSISAGTNFDVLINLTEDEESLWVGREDEFYPEHSCRNSSCYRSREELLGRRQAQIQMHLAFPTISKLTNGQYLLTFRTDRYLPPGEYLIPDLTLRDEVGNKTALNIPIGSAAGDLAQIYYEGTNIPLLSFDLVNLGSVDVSSPTFAEERISILYARNPSEVTTIFFRLEDDLSDISPYGGAAFYALNDPSGASSMVNAFQLRATHVTRVSADDNLYAMRLPPIDDHMPKGDYVLGVFYVFDNVGNQLGLLANDASITWPNRAGDGATYHVHRNGELEVRSNIPILYMTVP